MQPNKCPICETPMPGPWQEYPAYPFCSPRCKLIDLGRWLGENYAIAKPQSDAKSANHPDNSD